VYMVVDNANNLSRRAKGLKSQFDDDCGAWTEGRCATTTHWMQPSGEFKYLFVRNGEYCQEKVVAGKRTYVSLEPQPLPKEVWRIQRYYATQLNDGKPSYRKRVSWLAQVNGQPVALVEYLGKCTRAVPHGNSNCSDRHYVRTPSTTMTTIAEQVKTGSAKVIYDSMITSLDIDNAPRDGRVVANKKYHDNRKQRRQAGNQYRVTFADEMQTLCSMVPTDDFIRSVTVTNARVIQIILYSDRQMTDIKSFCFDRINGSVLSFDKTYNLGNMYVTVGVYRNLALQRAGSGDLPIFLGPMFIHGNSDFETYAHFFCNLSVRLASCDCRGLRLGSDEEASVRKAMQHAFRDAVIVCCTRHLKENLRRHALKVCCSVY